MPMKITVHRGDVVDVDLSGAVGSEKMNHPSAGTRPCVVVQNDFGNKYFDLTIIVPLTDTDQFKDLPVQVWIDASDINMTNKKDSVAECGHIRPIDGDARVKNHRGSISASAMARIDAALKVSLHMP